MTAEEQGQEPEPWTTHQWETRIRNVYAMHFGGGDLDHGYEDFDRWVAAHDAAVRADVEAERDALRDAAEGAIFTLSHYHPAMLTPKRLDQVVSRLRTALEASASTAVEGAEEA